jgi:YfiR/HmsC-like
MGVSRLVRHFVHALRPMVLCGALLVASGSGGALAQSSSGEADAKAKFTITLARFVQWPPGVFAADSSPLRLCVLHNSAAVAAAFARHDGEAVAGHPVSVVPNPGPRLACELLFIDASAARAGAAALVHAAGTPVLTLGSVDGFLSQGGMVELVNVNDALRFDVSLKAVRSAQLGLSSQVLRLARQVRD